MTAGEETATMNSREGQAWKEDAYTLIAALVRLLRAVGYDPEQHCADEELDSLLALVDKVVTRYQCPHCEPCHGDPHRASWGVRVAPQVDGDGQPTHLIVQPSDGAHVAQTDADWLFLLIRDRLCVHVADVPTSPEDPPSPETVYLGRRHRLGRGA